MTKLTKTFPVMTTSTFKHLHLLVPNTWSLVVIDLNVLYKHPKLSATRIGKISANIIQKQLTNKILNNLEIIDSNNNKKEPHLRNSARFGLGWARNALLLNDTKNGYPLTKLGKSIIKNNKRYVNQYNKIINLVNAGKISPKKKKYGSKSQVNNTKKSSVNLKSILKFILENKDYLAIKNEIRKNQSIQQFLETYRNAEVIPGKQAKPKHLNHKLKHLGGVKKPDYNQEHKYHMGLGKIGEQKVINYEKRKLLKANKPELAAKVNSESEKDDRAGYDINSFFKDSGKRLDIEVKTTSATSNIKPFHITKNEWNYAKNNVNNYRLYFLHSTKQNNGKVNLKLCHPYTFYELNKLYKEVVSYIIHPGYLRNTKNNK